MQETLLKRVVKDIGGSLAVSVVELLMNKKDVNEFLIEKKLNVTINQIRNVLYKLSNLGLVSFTRKKDKRKGWYTYFWTLNKEKILEFLNKSLDKKINDLKSQLKTREEKRFYICKTCKIEVSEEKALLNNFECPECGEVYELSNSEKIIRGIKKEIEKLKNDKEEVLKEIEKLKETKEKKTRRKKQGEKKTIRKRKKTKEKKKRKKPTKKTKTKGKTKRKKKK